MARADTSGTGSGVSEPYSSAPGAQDAAPVARRTVGPPAASRALAPEEDDEEASEGDPVSPDAGGGSAAGGCSCGRRAHDTGAYTGGECTDGGYADDSRAGGGYDADGPPIGGYAEDGRSDGGTFSDGPVGGGCATCAWRRSDSGGRGGGAGGRDAQGLQPDYSGSREGHDSGDDERRARRDGGRFDGGGSADGGHDGQEWRVHHVCAGGGYLRSDGGAKAWMHPGGSVYVSGYASSRAGPADDDPPEPLM